MQCRDMGIRGVDGMPWGTHLCLYYETRDDLIESLIPYFLAGLKHNECCVFVASGLLDAEEAEEVMLETNPAFRRYLQSGQMRILSHTDWYLTGGVFDADAVIDRWLEMLRMALNEGYDGLRVAGDTSWVEIEHWRSFLGYENRLVEIVPEQSLIVLCLYALHKCNVLRIIEIVDCHRAALVKRDGEWRLIESADLKLARKAIAQSEKIAGELRKVNKRLEYEIAERRQAEEHFATAFQASPNPIFIITIRDKRYINVNEAWTNILGYPRHTVVGRTMDDVQVLIRPKPQDLVEMIDQQKRIRNLELRVRTHAGEERIWSFSADIVHLNGERCMLGTTVDVTEQRKWQRQMARFDRLDLIGRMAASIAHEVRNPMSSARGFVQMLQEKENCAVYKDYFQLIVEELDRANAIISEFLSLARDRVRNLRKVNLNNSIRALFPMIEANAMKENKTVTASLRPIPELALDERELRQLVLNMARNGLEAMSPGGTLTIETYLDGDHVVLSIRDEGTGIAPEVLEELGTPFFTTKENGTGLGLAVCFSIAAKHNATITVETGAKGTVFNTRFSVLNSAEEGSRLYPVKSGQHRENGGRSRNPRIS